MTDATIFTTTTLVPERASSSVQAVYPFVELAPDLEQLKGQCAGLADDTARVIRETAATLDALIAEAEQDLARLRHAHTVTRELDDEQAAHVLHQISEHAKTNRPVGFQPQPKGVGR